MRGEAVPPFVPVPNRGMITLSIMDGWVVRDIEVGFVSFGKPGLRKPGALPSLHVMPMAMSSLPLRSAVFSTSAALLKRKRRADGMAPVNAKRVYRLMKKHSLLLKRHTGRRNKRESESATTSGWKLPHRAEECTLICFV